MLKYVNIFYTMNQLNTNYSFIERYLISAYSLIIFSQFTFDASLYSVDISARYFRLSWHTLEHKCISKFLQLYYWTDFCIVHF